MKNLVEFIMSMIIGFYVIFFCPPNSYKIKLLWKYVLKYITMWYHELTTPKVAVFLLFTKQHSYYKIVTLINILLYSCWKDKKIFKKSVLIKNTNNF